jgi:uncharacterized Zn finger protein (UPF0148 family)
MQRSERGTGYFYCKVCQTDYNIESMGVSAIKAHRNNKKHNNNMEQDANITALLQRPNQMNCIQKLEKKLEILMT